MKNYNETIFRAFVNQEPFLSGFFSREMKPLSLKQIYNLFVMTNMTNGEMMKEYLKFSVLFIKENKKNSSKN